LGGFDVRFSPYSEETRRRAAQEALARKADGHRFFLRDVAAEMGVRPATIRNWVAAYIASDEGMPAPPASPARLSPFPLRGILFCGLCDLPMAWGFSGSGAGYHCVPPCRRAAHIDAQAVHFEALRAVLASAPDFARGGATPPVHAIAGVVSRITVGLMPAQLTIRWRPAGYDRHTFDPSGSGGPKSGYAA
jgi:transposase